MPLIPLFISEIKTDGAQLASYQRIVPKVQLPNKARMAVSLVVNYEEESKCFLLDGDSQHESNGEAPSPVPSYQSDVFNESFFEYGSRVGI
jgi:hypothetical protein